MKSKHNPAPTSALVIHTDDEEFLPTQNSAPGLGVRESKYSLTPISSLEQVFFMLEHNRGEIIPDGWL